MAHTDHHGKRAQLGNPYYGNPSGNHSNGVSLANRGCGEHRYRDEEDKRAMRKRARRIMKANTRREVDSEI